MAETIETLRERMEAAAAALDFEEARRLRDRISLMRGGATADEAAGADTSGMTRQRPGSMGSAPASNASTRCKQLIGPDPSTYPAPRADL